MVNKLLMRRQHILLRRGNSKLTINIHDQPAARRASRREPLEGDGRMDTAGTCRALALAGTCLATLASGAARAADTATPVRHLVVVVQEIVPFDHYFAAYPGTAPLSGRPA